MTSSMKLGPKPLNHCPHRQSELCKQDERHPFHVPELEKLCPKNGHKNGPDCNMMQFSLGLDKGTETETI